MLISGNGDLFAYAWSQNLVTTLNSTDGNSYRITVSYDEESGIPENAVLNVTEINENDESFGNYIERSAETQGHKADDITLAKAFDISIVDPETGVQYQPNNKVSVTIELLDDRLERYGDIGVVHIDDEKTESISSQVKDGTVKFDTYGFSVYVVTAYTVDFHWGNYKYSIKGEDSVTLSELFKRLAITEIDFSEVDSVVFSNPTLVKVEKIDGDWILTSLRAFSTEEKLTLTVNNTEVVIRVTDQGEPIAQGTWENGSQGNGTWVIDADGVMTISGTGKMKDYSAEPWVASTPWYRDGAMRSDIKKVIITDGITHIGTNSFTRAYALEEVDVSQCTTLVSTGTDVFKMTGNPSGTTQLKTIKFSGCSSFKTLGQNVFSNTTNLITIDFSGCSSLSLSSFGNQAFASDKKIKDINISGTKITDLSKFDAGIKTTLTTLSAINVIGVTSINLSEYTALKYIDYSDSTSLSSINLPASVVEVDLTGCNKLSTIDLTGKTNLKTISFPSSITTISGINGCSSLQVINFDGSRAKWNKICSNNGITLAESVVINCLPPEKSTNLNMFIDDASVYSVGNDTTEYPVTKPAVINTSEDTVSFVVGFHYSEVPEGGHTDPRQLDIIDIVEPGTPTEHRESKILTYTLPEGFTPAIGAIENCSATLNYRGNTKLFVGMGFDYDPETRVVSFRIDFSGHSEEQITSLDNATNIEITIEDLVLEIPKDSLPLKKDLGFASEDYTNTLIFKADKPHNPKIATLSALEYDTINSTITYTLVISAEGGVDNEDTYYPVVINNSISDAAATESALGFASGTFTYAHNGEFDLAERPESVVSGGGVSRTGACSSVSFSGFPVVVDHMYNGDTITFTYTANVDTSKIAINGSATAKEVGTSVQIVNETVPAASEEAVPNPYNYLSDDAINDYNDLPNVVFPELKQTLEASLSSGDYPVFSFSVYLAGLKDADLSGGAIVLEDVFDNDNSTYSKLWKISDESGYEVKAYRLSSLTEDITGKETTVSAIADPGTGMATFIISDVKDGEGKFWNFYKIDYSITAKDPAALKTLKEILKLNEQRYAIGEVEFTNRIGILSAGSSLGHSDTKYVYRYLPITKTFTGIDGNWASYKIDINPDKMVLSGGAILKLTDTFTGNQSIDYSTIKITTDPLNSSVSYDYSSNTGTFYIPDETHVTITYTTRITESKNDETIFGNTANLNGSNAEGAVTYSAITSQGCIIYPGGNDILDSGGIYHIRMFVYAEGHMEKGLKGATYRLLDSNKQPIRYERNGTGITAGDIITFTTDNNGYANVKLLESEGGVSIKKNTVYYLEEVTAPVSDDGHGGKTYYKNDHTLYSFVVSDNPSYKVDGIWTFFNDDILKIRYYTENQGVFVSKRFSGNASITDDQKNAITFVLEKKNGSVWEEVESGTYHDFLWGSYLWYNNGREGSTLAEGTYRVREINHNPNSTWNSLSWSISMVGNSGQSVINGISTDKINPAAEFEVNAYNKTHCIDILFDNEYVENKLTIKTVDADDASALEGAVYTVYTSLGQIIGTKTSNNKGIIDIKWTDFPAFKNNTLYYAVQTREPLNHMLPDDPEKTYFYFSPTSESWLPTEYKGKAINLSKAYTTVTFANNKSIVNIPVLKVWDIWNGEAFVNTWPDGIDHINIGLYRSINGSEEVQVTDALGDPLLIKLTKEKPFNTDFANMAAVDAAGNKIIYSVREMGVYTDAEETNDVMAQFAPSYSVLNSGVYIVRNAEGISIDVIKEWYDEESGHKITNPDTLADKRAISFDIYRSVTEIASDTVTRGAIANNLNDYELVQTGITIGNADGWRKTVSSLKKYNDNGEEYKYFVLESRNAAFEDNYVISAAGISVPRQLTIQNTGEAKPLCKIGDEQFYTLNEAMQYLAENDMYTATIEMLIDYIIVSSDVLQIPKGYDITLTTAEMWDGNVYDGYHFRPSEDDPTRTTAIITRYTTLTNDPMFSNLGTLTLQNIILDGAEVSANKAMIENDGKLDITSDVVLRNAVNSGNGGAVYSKSGNLTVSGAVLDNNRADRGGAIYAAAGNITIKDHVSDGASPQTSPSALSNNTAYRGGAVYYSGTGSINISGHTEIKSNKTVDGGNGGAIYSVNGSIIISENVVAENNTAELNGGVAYIENGTILFTGGEITSNAAIQNGGAFYAAGGSVSVSGGYIDNNTSVQGNGGAVYVHTGTANVSGGDLYGNTAIAGYGGVVYINSGELNVTGGVIGDNIVDEDDNSNKALNGSALYLNTGTANLSGGVITGNIASTGGAVGIGSESSRLLFAGTVQVNGNRLKTSNEDPGTASNVYLNYDSDSIINAAGLTSGAIIGVHVPDIVSDKRGIPGTRFGSYSSETNLDAFVNDRISGIDVVKEATSYKVLWGKKIAVHVRYLSSYASAFPQKSGGKWNGGKNGADYHTNSNYYPNISDGSVSLIAENLYPEFKNKISATAAYGGAFADTGADNIDYAEYITSLKWQDGDWWFTKRDGTSTTSSSIVLYYAEPAYISIENNTNLGDNPRNLTISAITANGKSVINSNTTVGYGFVVSKDGTTRTSLMPLTDDPGDLVLNSGKSIKIMLPGGCGAAYNLKALFEALDGDTAETTINVITTDAAEGTYRRDQEPLTSINDPGVSGQTLNVNGSTYEIIFESRKPICKIVISDDIPYTTADDVAKKNTLESAGLYEYLFTSITSAVSFANTYNIEEPVIQMLTDYLLPNTDKVDLPSGSRFTFTTATNANGSSFYYEGGTRAVISRDSGNKNSFIMLTGSTAHLTSSAITVSALTINNLIFDGKNLAGTDDGGAVKTLNAVVNISNSEFKNFVAGNGGAVYIEFGKVVSGNYNYDNIDFNQAVVTIDHVDFNGCQSNSKSNRQGGGAIWTNTKELHVSSCTITSCVADDQGGAIFHRMDTYVPGTMTELVDCSVTGSEARAAGAVETDTSNFRLIGSTFTSCRATQRNGGAVNIYSNNTATTTMPSIVYVSGCAFVDCHADFATYNMTNYGGGLRSAALETYVYDTSFTNCSSLGGGGLAVSNTNAVKAEIYGVTINGCSAIYAVGKSDSGHGGGIFVRGQEILIDDYEEAGKTTISTSISSCTAGQQGGGIFNYGTTTFAAINVSVADCSSGTASTGSNHGGGIYTGALNVSLTGCSMQDNITAGNGGGFCHNNTGAKSAVIDGCILTGNTAGGQGGGFYTLINTTIMNDSYIMSNQLSNNDILNAAGVWMNNTKTLTIGSDARASQGLSDTTTIRDNYTSDGKASNLRLSMDGANNNKASIFVRCNLNGDIYVVNAASKRTQFGSSNIENPSGFTDVMHVFKSDNSTLFGLLDRADSSGKKIVWSGDPVCKITDANGNLLFFKDGGSAIFDSLDVGDRNNKTKVSAFSLLRNADPDLYIGGEKYTGSVYCVKMLVEEYTVNKYITTTYTGNTIILTTAGNTDSDGYTYQGSAGSRAKLIRSSNIVNANMFTARLNVTLQNIILDGGTENGVSGDANSRTIVVDDSRANVILGTNAVVQNSIVKNTVSGSAVTAYGNGSGISVNNGSLVINGGTVQNCVSEGNGGGIYVASGNLTLSSGTIRNCTALNGGAIYKSGTGSLSMGGGTISNCRAIASENAGGNGGAVYLDNGSFSMSGGNITGCGTDKNGNAITKAGGAVFMADGKAMSMSGGRMTGNQATVTGGGIAIGSGSSSQTKLTFYADAYINRNYLYTDGVRNACNVELDRDDNTIINAYDLTKDAIIGIYIPGDMESGLFLEHGKSDKPFGTYDRDSDKDKLQYLRAFVNDRNNLRGGFKDKDGERLIYWIQIYFLKVSNQVLSGDPADKDRAFLFDITLTGWGLDKNGRQLDASDITNVDTYGSMLGKYGNDIPFVEGKARVSLKNGESVLAENLPGDMGYIVEEVIDDNDANYHVDLSYYTTIPAKNDQGKVIITGKLGENNVNGVANYESDADFVNIHAVCKITSPENGLLYYRNGKNYEPAVYLTLSDALKPINNSVLLYYYNQSDSKYLRYTANNGEPYTVEFLIENYTIEEAVSVKANKNVTLTTASEEADDGYRYAGGHSIANIIRGHNSGSMIEVLGSLTLGRITLDGNCSTYNSVSGNGGLVRVGRQSGGSQASLTISTGVTLKDSIVSGYGAGVYLFENGVLNISGDPKFENNTKSMDGYSSKLNGGSSVYTDNKVEQDICIAENNAEPSSIVINGELTGDDGSIWVWAGSEKHYKSSMPFARFDTGITADSAGNLKMFRNACPDDMTENDTGEYLYGTKEHDGDEVTAFVYWTGVAGTRKVILRKVNGVYDPVADATFTVYRAGSNTPYHDKPTNTTLSGITSGSSGVFWAGELPLGTYDIRESYSGSVYWFTLTISGAEGSENTVSERRNSR